MILYNHIRTIRNLSDISPKQLITNVIKIQKYTVILERYFQHITITTTLRVFLKWLHAFYFVVGEDSSKCEHQQAANNGMCVSVSKTEFLIINSLLLVSCN